MRAALRSTSLRARQTRSTAWRGTSDEHARGSRARDAGGVGGPPPRANGGGGVEAERGEGFGNGSLLGTGLARWAEHELWAAVLAGATPTTRVGYSLEDLVESLLAARGQVSGVTP